MTDTIIIGLDGANWALLEPWLESGELPNIASLRDDGVRADMESCLPPVTCPNWRCYSTGKNPGKLGVYWWERIDTERRSLSTPTSRSFKSADYWDYLEAEGLATGVMNLPMTYPPLPMERGFLVAGGPGSRQDEYTSPASLGPELDERGYRLHPDVAVTAKSDRSAATDVVDLIDERLETFRWLLGEQDVDVAHLTVFYVNVLQHYFWRGDPTAAAWRVIDDHLGSIREEHPDATLILMSDHGCAEIDTMFYANSWLESEGFLRTTGGAGSVFDHLGINQTRVSGLAQRLGIHGALVSLTPEFVKRRVPKDAEGAKREQKLDRIDWEGTRAVASGQGLVYVIDDDRATRDEIVERLSALDSDVTGTPIASEVLTREEAYHGPYVSDAPNIVFEQTAGIHTSGAIGDNPVFEDVSHWEAENVRTGLFLAAGPDIVGSIDRPVSITDVAPTVLHSVGCPVPADVDGRPLELFDRESPETTAPITPKYVEEASSEEVTDRLEDLGYLQ